MVAPELAQAYRDGVRNGRADKLLGIRLTYAVTGWAEDAETYRRYYAWGYIFGQANPA